MKTIRSAYSDHATRLDEAGSNLSARTQQRKNAASDVPWEEA